MKNVNSCVAAESFAAAFRDLWCKFLVGRKSPTPLISIHTAEQKRELSYFSGTSTRRLMPSPRDCGQGASYRNRENMNMNRIELATNSPWTYPDRTHVRTDSNEDNWLQKARERKNIWENEIEIESMYCSHCFASLHKTISQAVAWKRTLAHEHKHRYVSLILRSYFRKHVDSMGRWSNGFEFDWLSYWRFSINNGG